jgi:hypothetical protein
VVVVVEVDVVVDVDVVDVVVGAAVVTGTVVLVAAGVDVEEVLTTDDDVEPESGVVGSSLPHPAIVNAMMTNGKRRAAFTVGSLARFVAIT